MSDLAEMQAKLLRRTYAKAEFLYPVLHDHLETLRPLEAYVLLAKLMTETLIQFPRKERLALAQAWAESLAEGLWEQSGPL
jgi:hypothetical protein